MTIVHNLNNNFSFFLQCPICGAEFIESIKKLEEYKKKLTRNVRLIIDQTDVQVTQIKKEYNCSKCTFKVMYVLDLDKNIKECS